MNGIRLIVTDLDDTILRRDKTVSYYTIDVFKRAKKQGLLVAFATARFLDDSRDYRIILSPDGDIVTGGCLVFACNQLLRCNYLPEQQGVRLLAELCAHPLVKSVSARSQNARYSNIPIEGRICIDFSPPLPDKLLHCSFRTDDGTIVTSIAARYPEFLFLHVSGSDLYDINPKDATKLKGVKTLLDYYSINLSEVAAFGDDYNDIEMLRECGVGVAMRNSIDECKEVANYICGDCDEDGVANWIEENIL